MALKVCVVSRLLSVLAPRRRRRDHAFRVSGRARPRVENLDSDGRPPRSGCRWRESQTASRHSVVRVGRSRPSVVRRHCRARARTAAEQGDAEPEEAGQRADDERVAEAVGERQPQGVGNLRQLRRWHHPRHPRDPALLRQGDDLRPGIGVERDPNHAVTGEARRGAESLAERFYPV